MGDSRSGGICEWGTHSLGVCVYGVLTVWGYVCMGDSRSGGMLARLLEVEGRLRLV